MKPDPLSLLMAIGGGMPFFGNDSKPNIFAMGARPLNHSASPLRTHRHCRTIKRSKR